MIVRVKNIKAEAVIGVYEWEKKKLQPIIINLKMEYDASVAVKSDKINDAVDYCELTKKIVEKVSKTNFELLEKLVDFVLAISMEDKRVTWAEVEIDKIKPIEEYADSVSVTGQAER